MEKIFFIKPELINQEGSYEKLRDFIQDPDSNFSKVTLLSEIDIIEDTVIIVPSFSLSSFDSKESNWIHQNFRSKIVSKIMAGYILISEDGLKKLLSISK